MMSKEALSKICRETGLNSVYQDGSILLYNREPDDSDPDRLTKGILVADIAEAIAVATKYHKALTTQGSVSISTWAKEQPYAYEIVVNKTDNRSMYYVAMTTVTRINLLKAAKELVIRANISKEIGEVSPTALRRYRKMKKIAALARYDTSSDL